MDSLAQGLDSFSGSFRQPVELRKAFVRIFPLQIGPERLREQKTKIDIFQTQILFVQQCDHRNRGILLQRKSGIGIDAVHQPRYRHPIVCTVVFVEKEIPFESAVLSRSESVAAEFVAVCRAHQIHVGVDPPFFERVKQIGESVVACFIDSQVRFRPRHFFPVESLAEGMVIEGLDQIPAVVFINDGLTGEERGESEIETLQDFEKWYSRLSSADIDAERKSMNPTKYTIDMAPESTKDLSTGAGAYWDLQSDQNLDTVHPSVGILEPAMNYSDTLKQTLDRIKTVGYEQVDMPNITLETMTGAITSGKALKAVYWPLIVRCKEKMKMWGPKLQDLVNLIIKGSRVFPEIARIYTDDPLSDLELEVQVKQNLPLPEDEAEEKQLDIAEVEAKVMSRKAYMKKWRGLSDSEVEEELRQIALERQLIDDAELFPEMPGPEAQGSVLDVPVYGEV